MKTHLKTLISIILLVRATLGLCQQGYTYVLDEDWVYEPSIIKTVHGLLLTDDDKVIVSAQFLASTPYYSLIRLHPLGAIDNTFGFPPSALWGGGGRVYGVADGYMRFEGYPLKYGLDGLTYPGYDYYYNNHPYLFSADDRAVLPLPDARFYVSGRFFVDTLGGVRHLVRMMPDGSVDTTFTQRLVHEPAGGLTWRMMYYDDESIMVGGTFLNYEGHQSTQLVRVLLDGSVDTTFTSPLRYRGSSGPAHIDDAGRIYVTNPAGGLESFPIEDTLNVIRLMPSGAIDTSFHLPDFGGLNTPDGYLGVGIYGLLPEDDGGYIVYGVFSSVDGQPRNCIAKIDSSGYLVEDMFDNLPVFQLFNDSASWAQSWDYVQVRHIIRMPDGGILAGGLFTHFNGVERWNLVKLKKVPTTGVDELKQTKNTLGIFPNPATNSITITGFTAATQSTVKMYNMSGQQVLQQNVPAGSGSFSVQVQELPSGIYVIQLHSSGNAPMFGKVVINR
jgi:hypothetical protein